MEVYEATPDGDARGAVIAIQEAFGVNDHIKDVTRRAAAAGYHAVAPALFHRGGGGTAGYEEYEKMFSLFEGVTDEAVLVDVDATLDHLRGAGFSDEQIGIVGFCFGGRATFLVAARRSIGAAVGFYGGGIASKGMLPFDPLIDEAASLKTPWLGLFGDADTGIPIEDVEQLREALKPAAVATDIVRYEGAEHGFYCDARASYHPEAAKDAWGRALEWFGSHLS
ncbi:MAG: dienelactone hydrolase family protein [Actinobacteria bacterium]|nr:dienelactone hydrolase family protein [Actinomycetota bacterium]